MKVVAILLFSFYTLCACKKNTQENSDWFQIEITAQKNIDCGFPEIIFLNRKQQAYQIIGDSKGIYIALGLPKVNYPVGTKMFVSIHKPDVNETVICTTLGPSWSQVFIENIK